MTIAGLIRVLVVDDSVASRALLARLLQADGHFTVVGTAGDGEDAIAQTALLRPDVITMDIHMPRLDGLSAIRRIMAVTPTPIVVVTASAQKQEVDLAFQALQAGALTVLDKPPGPADPHHSAAARELLTTVRLMSEVRVVRRWTPAMPSRRANGKVASGAVPAGPAVGGPRLIALAASTGGPQAIQTVLQSLDHHLTVPMLVVQHISPGFAGGMAEWLAATCPQLVKLAEHGETPVAGTVYLAPSDAHLIVTHRGALALSKAPPSNGFRPSANVLFESVAECFGSRAIGILLTGMGDDGAAGLGQLRAAGATTIAQDQASSVVFGMPGAAVALDAASRVLPLSSIGGALHDLLTSSSPTPVSSTTERAASGD
jgi:two-component system chemotaxis response regulator CheB